VILRRWIVITGAVVTMLWPGALLCAEGSEACEAQRSGWIEAHEFLEQTMSACQDVKQGPLASRINQAMKTGQSPSIAGSVQTVLKERSVALAVAMQKCREAAALETQAFDDWRRCARGIRSRKGDPVAVSPDSVNAARKQTLTLLQDLLLDEAYAQYKNYKAPAAPDYADYQHSGWGPGAAMGNQVYRGYGGYR
jgi:hypothetical protein